MSFTKRYPLGLKELLNNIRITLQNSLLPSGAIVWFNLPNPPNGWVVCNGTNGTPNLIGRYPLGATSAIGTTVEAGLPNIELALRVDGTSRQYYSKKLSEYTTDDYGGTLQEPTRNSDEAMAIMSSANITKRGGDLIKSDIYGKSNTVTPPSVKLLPCMKL